MSGSADSQRNLATRTNAPSAAPTTAERADSAELSLPERIGRYRILARIGEGGMGAVFRAEQESPRRVVALKVIRAGLASDRLLRRFEYEAQVLGRLQHPGIAQIFEAGAVEGAFGRMPYFAMELVEGRPLGDHVLFERLDTKRKLELLARICDAVEHAHQKGVIHRDLKPANILVDRAGQPKVLDFGVARLVDGDLEARHTLQTAAGEMVGTLAYMSPEQVRGDSADVDTRSDVYALGVIGYEMLAQRMPYDLLGKSLTEVADAICTREALQLTRTRRTLDRDLNTLFAKALEKDKARRYQSAAEFAADLRRCLRDEPIQARPASAVYQLRKFARRHRALVAGACTTLLAIVGGLIGTAWFAWRASFERDQAIAARTLAEQRRELAERNEAKAAAVLSFLNHDILGAADPTRSPGQDVSLVDVVKRAAATIDGGSLASQPGVEAAVRHTLGATFASLGLYADAERHARAAVDLARAGGESERVALADNLAMLADLRWNAHDYETAEPLYREALALVRTSDRRQERIRAATVRARLANLLADKGDLTAAEELHRQVLDLRIELLGAEHADVSSSLHNLGSIRVDLGDLDGGARAFQAALDMRLKLFGPLNESVALTRMELAGIEFRRGNYLAAADATREVVATLREIFGPRHPRVARALNNLAVFMDAAGDPAQAESILREVVEMCRANPGGMGPVGMNAVSGLARIVERRGNWVALLEVADAEVDIARELFGEQHPEYQSALERRAAVLQRAAAPPASQPASDAISGPAPHGA